MFCSQDTMNGLAFLSLLFLRANNALSRGSNKDKLTDFFSLSQAYQILSFIHLTHLFTFSSLHPHEHL